MVLLVRADDGMRSLGVTWVHRCPLPILQKTENRYATASPGRPVARLVDRDFN